VLDCSPVSAGRLIARHLRVRDLLNQVGLTKRIIADCENCAGSTYWDIVLRTASWDDSSVNSKIVIWKTLCS